MPSSSPSEPSQSGPSQRRSGAYHQWIRRHPWHVLAVGLVVFLGAGALALRLQLRTAFSELLPSDDPGVISLTKTSKRIGDLSLLLIGIHSPGPAANELYAEVQTQKLRALPG